MVVDEAYFRRRMKHGVREPSKHVVGDDEVAEQCVRVQQRQRATACQRQPVAAEPVPHELPLRCDVVFGLSGSLGALRAASDHRSPTAENLMRGSIATSSRSERDVPTMVVRLRLRPPRRDPLRVELCVSVIDMTGSGYGDVLAVCHRTDLGHRVDSLLFGNGPQGLDLEHPTRLPGMGPHLSTPRDFGNAFTREPCERYRSAPYELAGREPVRVGWTASTPPRLVTRARPPVSAPPAHTTRRRPACRSGTSSAARIQSTHRSRASRPAARRLPARFRYR